MACLRPHNHSTSSCEEDEKVTSDTPLLSPSQPVTSSHHATTSSSTQFSISPGSGQDLAYYEDLDDVFMVEEKFGSFVVEKSGHDLTPQPHEEKRKKRRSRNYFKSSSSGESSSSKSPFLPLQRPSSIKKLIPRSFSGILRPSTGDRNFQDSSNGTSIICSLHEFSSSLLHVYRTNTLPPEGLHGFHHKVTQLVRQGEEGMAAQWWRREVVPGGTRVVGVKVVGVKEEEGRVRELVEAWRSLYTSTLPLLLSLLVPLQCVDVRQDVLVAFRDTVVPYAALPDLACKNPDLLEAYSWPLTQMMLRLARVGPCTCDLSGTEIKETSSLRQEVKEEVTRDGEEVTKEAGEEEEKRQKHRDNEAVEVLKILLADKTSSLDISPASFSQLLHLHHGHRSHYQNHNHYYRNRYHSQTHHHRRHSFHNSRYFFSSYDIQGLEEPWQPHLPSSYKTLEDMFKSAATR